MNPMREWGEERGGGGGGWGRCQENTNHAGPVHRGWGGLGVGVISGVSANTKPLRGATRSPKTGLGTFLSQLIYSSD